MYNDFEYLNNMIEHILINKYDLYINDKTTNIYKEMLKYSSLIDYKKEKIIVECIKQVYYNDNLMNDLLVNTDFTKEDIKQIIN